MAQEKDDDIQFLIRENRALRKELADKMLELIQIGGRASRLENTLRAYHGFATYYFWWINRDYDLGLDMDLCYYGWDGIADREIINELFPEKKREENEAEWEELWQILNRHKNLRFSGEAHTTDLDDIWKSFKTV